MIARLAIALAVLAGAGCVRTRTEVLLVVRSDLTVPDQLDQVEVVVAGAGAAAPFRERYTLAPAGNTTLPLSLGLVPSGDRGASFRVTVTGLATGVPGVERSAATAFVPGETVILYLDLLTACLDRLCPASTTCDTGPVPCRPEAIDPASLPRVGRARPENEPLEASVPPDALPLPADGPTPDAPALEGAAPIDGPIDRAIPTDAGAETGPPVDLAADLPPAWDVAPDLPVVRVCQPGARFCMDAQLRQCSTAGDTSTLVVTCASNEYCDTAAGSCRAKVCMPNQTACAGNRATTCSADGSRYAIDKDCGADHCQDGQCIPYLFRENFEDGNIDGWSAAPSDLYSHAVTTPGANGTGHALTLTRIKDSGFGADGMSRTLPAPIQPKVVSFWVRAEQMIRVGGYFNLAGSPNPSDSIAFLDFYDRNIILSASSTLPAPYVTYNPKQWYHIEYRNIDWQNHTFEYFIDDTLIAKKVGMATPQNQLLHIDLYHGSADPSPAPATSYDEIEFR